MSMTMTQKILAAHAGVEKVEAGELILVSLDRVLGNDITSPVAIREFNIKTKHRLNKILAKNSGKPYEEVEKDTDRDNYLSAEDAKEYGLIDEIFYKRP